MAGIFGLYLPCVFGLAGMRCTREKRMACRTFDARIGIPRHFAARARTAARR